MPIHPSPRVRLGVSIGVLTIAAVATTISVAGPANAVAATPLPASCRSIPVDADQALRSDVARADFGLDGSGVKVGVISLSYEDPALGLHPAADDVAAGLLPGPGNPCGRLTSVRVLADRVDPNGNDEGRAMLQLVHGIAPGAELMFSAVDDEDPVSIAAAVDRLAAAGADVIVDDIGTGKETFFQRSIVGLAIERATAGGVVYLSAAGNGAGAAQSPRPGQEVTEISGWDTSAYRATSCPPAVAEAVESYGFAGALDCMDFDQGAAADPTLGYSVESRRADLLYLQWGEPAGNLRGDFVPVAFLNGTALPAPPTALPAEVPGYEFVLPAEGFVGELEVAMVRVSDPADPDTLITPPLALRVPGYMLDSAEYPVSQGDDVVGRSIYGHNGDPATISVAAAPAADPFTLEDFTSAGPTVFLFTPQGPGATALTEPLISPGPDVVSVDKVRNSVLGRPSADPGIRVFGGTSAAAPNAAAVVALALQADPTIGQERARELLRSTARPVASTHPGIPAENVVGAGLIDARAVVSRVVAELPTTPGRPVVPAPRPTLAATGVEVGPAGLTGLATALIGSLIWSGSRRHRRA